MLTNHHLRRATCGGANAFGWSALLKARELSLSLEVECRVGDLFPVAFAGDRDFAKVWLSIQEGGFRPD
jgi:hypothetical protein